MPLSAVVICTLPTLMVQILPGLSLKVRPYRGATFVGSMLTGTDFSRSDLTGVSFDDQTLEGVMFDSASLKKTTFRNAILRDVSFHHTAVKHAIFDGATMDKITYAILKSAKATLNDIVLA